MNIYGIRQEKGKVIAITRFQKVTEIPNEFREITESEYKDFVAFFHEHPFSKYNAKNNKLIAQPERKKAMEAALKVSAMRMQLKKLKEEIDLTQAIGDDPAGLKSEFDKLKKEYQELKRE